MTFVFILVYHSQEWSCYINNLSFTFFFLNNHFTNHWVNSLDIQKTKVLIPLKLCINSFETALFFMFYKLPQFLDFYLFDIRSRIAAFLFNFLHFLFQETHIIVQMGCLPYSMNSHSRSCLSLKKKRSKLILKKFFRTNSKTHTKIVIILTTMLARRKMCL